MAKSNAQNKPQAQTPEESNILGVTPDAGVVPETTRPEPQTVGELTKEVMETETIQIPASTFNTIMERLNSLESKNVTGETNMFNPLEASKEKKVCNISFLYDEETGEGLPVVGYKPRIMPDRSKQLVWNKRDKETGETKGYCIPIVMRKGKVEEMPEMSHYDFLQTITTQQATVEEVKSEPVIVEQGFTIQRIWNGQKLQETGTKVMTGYKMMKNLYVVSLGEEKLTIDDSVINMK